MKRYSLSCEILSPLHIGTGDELDPLNYIIKGETMYRISFDRLVGRMDDAERTALEALIDEGNLLKLRRFVVRHPQVLREPVCSVAVTPSLAKLYSTKLDDIQNQLLIHPFMRTQGGAIPFIPGSSLKGAIRTAVVSELAKGGSLPKPGGTREEYEFEARVLDSDDAKNDPFRGLKIRDAALSDSDMIVAEVRNLKRKGSSVETNSIQMMCEITRSRVSGNAVTFETELLLDDGLHAVGFIKKPLSAEQVVMSCNNFYREKMETEHKKFYRGSRMDGASAALLGVALEPGEFLLRMGRFSGVESVTLDGYRNPKPPGKRGIWGTTRNIADDAFPMGWMKVRLVEIA